MQSISTDALSIEETLNLIIDLMHNNDGEKYKVDVLPELLIQCSKEIKLLRLKLAEAYSEIYRLLGKPERTSHQFLTTDHSHSNNPTVE